MIADLGLSKQLNVEITSNSTVHGMQEYIEPQCFKIDNYVRDKKSDIYSLGVLLWEISSGCPPFSKIPFHTLSYRIANGLREQPIINTPLTYVNLYKKCWNDDPNLRPTTIDDIFDTLEMISEQFNETNSIIKDLSELDINNEINSNFINQNNLQSQSNTDSIYELSLSQVENQISKYLLIIFVFVNLKYIKNLILYY